MNNQQSFLGAVQLQFSATHITRWGPRQVGDFQHRSSKTEDLSDNRSTNVRLRLSSCNRQAESTPSSEANSIQKEVN